MMGRLSTIVVCSVLSGVLLARGGRPHVGAHVFAYLIMLMLYHWRYRGIRVHTTRCQEAHNSAYAVHAVSTGDARTWGHLRSRSSVPTWVYSFGAALAWMGADACTLHPCLLLLAMACMVGHTRTSVALWTLAMATARVQGIPRAMDTLYTLPIVLYFFLCRGQVYDYTFTIMMVLFTVATHGDESWCPPLLPAALVIHMANARPAIVGAIVALSHCAASQ